MQLKTANLVMTEIENELVVLDTSTSTYLSINAAGKVLVDALAVDVRRDRLVDLLQGEFGLDRAVAERDCQAFLDEIERHGWLLTGPADS